MKKICKKIETFILFFLMVFSICPKVVSAEDNNLELNTGVSYHNPVKNSDGTVTYDCVWFGNFWQNDINGDGKVDMEPIKWRILSASSDDLFLLSDKVINGRAFNYMDIPYVNWKQCTIRSWLNGYGPNENYHKKDYTGNGLIDRIFSDLEKKEIKISTIQNSMNGEEDIVTDDKLFLLSLEDVTNPDYGFSGSKYTYDDARKAKFTDYCKNKCIVWYDNTNTYATWILRTAWDRICGMITFFGEAHWTESMDYTRGVRPALHISPSSNLISYAGTVCTDGTVNENEPKDKTFTVTFESNGGSSIPAQTVDYASQIVMPANPEKKGYNFIGWYKDEELTKLFDFYTPITSNITIYAKWSINDDVELEAKAYAFKMHENGEETILPIKWSFSDFQKPSTQYNHRLAIAGLALSAATSDNSSCAYKTLDSMGFENIWSNNNYGNDVLMNTPAITYGSHKMTVRGVEKTVIVMAIRGTSNLGDIVTDITALVNGFSEAGNYAKEELEWYLANIAKVNTSQNNTILFITGHSLGGAIAGRLAQTVGDIAPTTNTYIYTYGSPGYDRDNSSYDNVFNIINEFDTVPNLALTKGRVGTDMPYGEKQENFSFDMSYLMLTGEGKTYQQMMEIEWSGYKKNPNLLTLWQGFFQHTVDSLWLFPTGNCYAAFSHDVRVYMAFLLSDSPVDSISNKYVWIVKAECPVDVKVYDSKDIMVASVINDKVTYPEYTDIVVMTDGDKKYIIMPYDSDYRIETIGNAVGSMKYTIEKVDSCGNLLNESKVFENVLLEQGKTFNNTVSDDVSVNDTSLFVMDQEGEIQSEVEPDGTEINYINNRIVVKQKLDISELFNAEYGRYSVEPKNLASINRNGVLTGKKSGTVTVTGLVKNKKTWQEDSANSIEVIIEKPKIEEKVIILEKIGEEFLALNNISGSQINPTGWVSSNLKVAYVDNNGLIKAVGKGNTKITAVYGEGKNAAKYSFMVKCNIPSISRRTAKMLTGAILKLKLNNTKQKPEWISSNNSIATVSDGKVKALTAGDVIISAVLDGISYDCKITVKAPRLKKSKVSVKVGKKVTVGLTKTKIKEIIWESGDKSIATVDKKGNVTGIAPGETIVYTNTGGLKNECMVTVTK